MGENLNRYFSEEDIQMANRHTRRCLTSLITRKLQVRITMSSHPIPVKMTVIKRQKTSVGKDVEKRERLCTVAGL